jgi:hypothetical protein
VKGASLCMQAKRKKLIRLGRLLSHKAILEMAMIEMVK